MPFVPPTAKIVNEPRSNGLDDLAATGATVRATFCDSRYRTTVP